MIMKKITIIIFLFATNFIYGQDVKKLPRYFGETIRIDSTNNLLMTVQYNSDLFSSKFAFEDYFANIILFNYTTNTQKRIFENDTYIKPFRERYSYYDRNYENKKLDNISKKNIYLFVKNVDYDKNNKIDDTDPFILYVCDLNGFNLKPISPSNENAVSFELFEELNFMLIRIQRDYNKDFKFSHKDKDYYYLKIDLQKFEVVTKIEMITDIVK